MPAPPPASRVGQSVEVMDGAEVAAVGEGSVIPETGVVGLLGGLEFVEELREQFALFGVASVLSSKACTFIIGMKANSTGSRSRSSRYCHHCP